MSPSLLCETVTGSTMADLIGARDAAVDSDMLELRLDGVSDLQVARVLNGCRHPVIATCRASWEGGRFDGAEEERLRILTDALDCGADFVDVEWRALRVAGADIGFDGLLQHHRERVVVSFHDFVGMPDDLSQLAKQMRAAGAPFIKIAVTPTRLSDTLPLREIGIGGGAIVIGMGEVGVPTRLLAARFGSPWTYCGNAAAPGQVPATRMLTDFRFRSVGQETALYGVAGPGAMRSALCAVHNAAFADIGIEAVSVPLPARDVDDFATFADTIDIAGASLALPFELRGSRLSAAIGGAAPPYPMNVVRRAPTGWEATVAGGVRQPASGSAESPTHEHVAQLAEQATCHVEWWTGRRPRAEAIHAAAVAAVGAGGS